VYKTGLGILWEARLHREVRSLLSASWALGSVIATVGSGVAALLKAVRIDGTPFVTGRRVSSSALPLAHLSSRCALHAFTYEGCSPTLLHWATNN
jgi:hypothetical protein